MWKTPKKKKSSFVDSFVHQESSEKSSETDSNHSIDQEPSKGDLGEENTGSHEGFLDQSFNSEINSEKVSLRVLGI